MARGPHTCKYHNHAHHYERHTCGHEYCPYYWRGCPRCHGTHEGNRISSYPLSESEKSETELALDK